MAVDSTHLLDLNILQPNPFQPRGQMDKEELSELAESIKKFGILEPLVVAQTPAGYQIIAGERRWRAAKLAGMTEVPVVIRKTTPTGMLEMAVVENLQRTNLNALERAKAFQQLMQTFGHTVGKIGERLGKSHSFVSNTLRLLNLLDAVKDGLLSGQITEGHARCLVSLKDPKQIIEIYKTILKENTSVRQTEQLVRMAMYQADQVEAVPRYKVPNQIPKERIQEVVEKLSQQLESKPMVKVSRSKELTRVTISLKGDIDTAGRDLERVLRTLENPTA